MTQAPHWEELLDDLWELAGEETFESVDVPEYCEEHGYDEETVTNIIDVMPAWEYVEYGVSPRYPWFHAEWD